MATTPHLSIADDFTLRPANKAVLSSVIEAFNEDRDSAMAALPWIDMSKDINRQLSDMLFDIESASDADRLHFWSIHDKMGNFAGMVGVGDELQFSDSHYNLGYWVKPSFRSQGIAVLSVNSILSWLESRGGHFRIEVAVHPHNEAGLATAEKICSHWNGQTLEEFVGVELFGRTIPHKVYLIDLPQNGE
ncbi:MAG TPA: N-acetyltransferase [Candidatus Poseidoniales archaeon]|jgi:RimJ/RimL family protein N-acetyltransferase|nr:N-acetyltransferase [Candidatus Poseidoniales archaeon]